DAEAQEERLPERSVEAQTIVDGELLDESELLLGGQFRGGVGVEAGDQIDVLDSRVKPVLLEMLVELFGVAPGNEFALDLVIFLPASLEQLLGEDGGCRFSLLGKDEQGDIFPIAHLEGFGHAPHPLEI